MRGQTDGHFLWQTACAQAAACGNERIIGWSQTSDPGFIYSIARRLYRKSADSKNRSLNGEVIQMRSRTFAMEKSAEVRRDPYQHTILAVDRGYSNLRGVVAGVSLYGI